MRRTKIIATVGPATASEERLRDLLLAGADALRLNFSHGTADEHRRSLMLARRIASELGRPLAVIQDLQGPKIRTGPLAAESVELVAGTPFTITGRPTAGDESAVSTTYRGLAKDVRPDHHLLLADGTIELRVLSTDGLDVRTEVVRGGVLRSHQGINLPGVPVSISVPTDKDLSDMRVGVEMGVDYVALSFVRGPEDVRRARSFLRSLGARTALIAKLEKPEAVEHLSSILRACDGVMVARGDLGVEVLLEKVPLLQKEIIRAANQRGVLAITATQMLDSMVRQPVPTRAEASDAANAVIDGSDALMLSAETAIGAYPVEAVAMLDRIIRETEAGWSRQEVQGIGRISDARALSRAARSLAHDLDVEAIVAWTRSGRTARLLSADRPRVPIFALAPDEAVLRELVLWWGVRPWLARYQESTDALVRHAEEELLRAGLLDRGARVIIVGSTPLVRGVHTNFLKLQVLGGRRPSRS
jgi:pyruvate kinase